VLAVADAVHLVSAFDREARLRAGDGPLAPAARREAIVAACGRLGGACLATSATTVLGFLSLTTSDLPALRQFGAFAAFGMAAAFATVVVVVPLLLAVTRASPGPPPGTRGLERLAALTLARRPVILLGFALLAAGAATAATRVRIDNRLSDLLDADHPVRIASETLDRELSGSLSLELQLVGSPGTFAHRASAPELAALERELQRELSARVVIGPGRFGDELLSADRSRARLSIRVAEPGGRAFEELAGRARAQVEPFARARGLEVEVGGTALLAYQGVNAIARDLRTSLLGMFVVVAIAVVWAARRVGHGLWAVLPNALPLLVGYATLGLLGIDLDPLAAVVLILALGIAVDDTIHLLAAMRAHPGARTDPAAAITSALVGSGRPIIVTSLVVSGGLAVDLLGSFPPLRLLGLLGAVVMLCALVCDLVLLPALVARR
jgi:predicted RND superfamily exporter protein